jgi:hypothetical protein
MRTRKILAPDKAGIGILAFFELKIDEESRLPETSKKESLPLARP